MTKTKKRQLTAEEREIIATLEQLNGKTMTDQQIALALEQALRASAIASLLCQRIDVADDVRDSLGSPSVTVVAIGPS